MLWCGCNISSVRAYSHTFHKPLLGAEAKNTLRMLQWSCFTIKPLLSPGLLLLPNWLQDLLTYFIGCFDSVGAKMLPAPRKAIECCHRVTYLFPDGATKSWRNVIAWSDNIFIFLFVQYKLLCHCLLSGWNGPVHLFSHITESQNMLRTLGL